jgi:hypothetical protein
VPCVRWTLPAPSNSTDFDFEHHPRACPKPHPDWDTSPLFNMTPHLLTKTDIASIIDPDVSSIEDSIGQPWKHNDLYILNISCCWDLHKHSLFAVLTFSLLTTLASFQTFLSYPCYDSWAIFLWLGIQFTNMPNCRVLRTWSVLMINRGTHQREVTLTYELEAIWMCL